MKYKAVFCILMTLILVSAYVADKDISGITHSIESIDVIDPELTETTFKTMKSGDRIIEETEYKENKSRTESVISVGGKPGNMLNFGLADSDEENIVYVWDNKIIIIDIEGSNRGVISNDRAQFVCIYDEWVYYRRIGPTSDPINGIYKMRKDGTELTQITSDTTQILYVVGEWIYYNNWSYTTDICRVMIDGSNKETLYKGQYDSLSTDGEHLYFSDFGKKKYIKAPMDGGEYEVIIDNQWGIIPQLAGDWIYYMDGETYEFMRMKKDGTENEKCSEGYPLNFITNHTYLYNGRFRQDIHTGEVTTWTDINYSKIQLVGNQVLLWVNNYSEDAPMEVESSSLMLITEQGEEVMLEFISYCDE
ncbi:uncharacterized protein DUF5050 [Natranaerovirga hydrolytica]|uniref:Uncharacterized protein DUF5050 n=1 Tax=Natranaerovirga hydrolytica TaxID=680378 RepID=A0A4V2Q1L0_9FIRM|nr:DUF5050 domain-containing protein [Natranaerovirga hydrolytica]TCK98031.1 uncharacterized protein DUF5050 [Natranaerovirga hydrolytica]